MRDHRNVKKGVVYLGLWRSQELRFFKKRVVFHFFTQFNPAYGLDLLSDRILFRGFGGKTATKFLLFGCFLSSKWQIIITVYFENLQSRMCHLNATVLSVRVASETGACGHLYTLDRSLHITVLATINCIKSDEWHSHYKPKSQTITFEWKEWMGNKLLMVWSKGDTFGSQCQTSSVTDTMWQTPLDVTTWPKPKLPVYNVQLLQLLLPMQMPLWH